ncbi:hypothetical protein [Limnoglobus roseus]|uniref:Uncharacterized protein n=1 Tax=Limnoglobus roseus TaxID=2598579 RepID=A0A5C1AI68_9BACT|nr:hypothetical protein [Limnoglobus roseus]QEL17696.1 hypothetical protein PX52LOC_04695 [Limnoglobus roseus]
MKHLPLPLVAVALAAAGCAPPDPALNTDVPTEKFIRLLETADIRMVAVTHAQHFDLETASGKQYSGTYDFRRAGKYSEHKSALSLANHILLEVRGLKDVPVATE